MFSHGVAARLHDCIHQILGHVKKRFSWHFLCYISIWKWLKWLLSRVQNLLTILQERVFFLRIQESMNSYVLGHCAFRFCIFIRVMETQLLTLWMQRESLWSSSRWVTGCPYPEALPSVWEYAVEGRAKKNDRIRILLQPAAHKQWRFNRGLNLKQNIFHKNGLMNSGRQKQGEIRHWWRQAENKVIPGRIQAECRWTMAD